MKGYQCDHQSFPLFSTGRTYLMLGPHVQLYKPKEAFTLIYYVQYCTVLRSLFFTRVRNVKSIRLLELLISYSDKITDF